MTEEEMDNLVLRANAAGHASPLDYCLDLHDTLARIAVADDAGPWAAAARRALDGRHDPPPGRPGV